ncbi:MAG: hypothetical protein KDJ73_01060, partial [Notoacmeibacter sp.]|nr:hypothetical protein [Notoacmeibacter sp.]
VDVNELVDEFAVALFALAAIVPAVLLCHILIPFSFPEARVELNSLEAGHPIHGVNAGLKT